MTIAFVGYRGSGKTTVAQALAQRLHWRFVDLDPLIEERAQLSIAEIFSQQGEPAFRKLERDLLAEQLKVERCVLSTGGGVVLDPQNRQRLKNCELVIWLQASVDTLAMRLAADETTASRRPSLSGVDVVSEIESVLTMRIPLYQEVCDLQMATDNRSVASIVDEIQTHLPPAPEESA